MATIDVPAVGISIQLLVVLLESSKPLLAVRNIQATIQSSLQQHNATNVKKLQRWKKTVTIKDDLYNKFMQKNSITINELTTNKHPKYNIMTSKGRHAP